MVFVLDVTLPYCFEKRASKHPHCMHLSMLQASFQGFPCSSWPHSYLYPPPLTLPAPVHHSILFSTIALAIRSLFIRFDFHLFSCNPVLQIASHKPYLNFKAFFVYEISSHFLEEITQNAAIKGWEARKRKKVRHSELHAPIQLSFVPQKG